MSTDSPFATLSGSVVLVGAGKMGGAMLEGWMARGLAAQQVVLIEPAPALEITDLAARGVTIVPDVGVAPRQDAVAAVFIAVKPQVAPQIVPVLRPLVTPSTVAVSIMAGKTLAFFSNALPGTAVVRAMPNTPAAIGRGITVAVANEMVTPAQRALAHDLLAAAGSVEWTSDEALIDAVTAVSGSGPAYVFYLAECLAAAGIAAGLPPDLAQKLARETVAGSGELLHRSPLDPAVLRKNVTSPGGTTAAALDLLMGAGGLAELMKKAVEAAARRSRELAG